ncbi:hypothetical protein G7Z17_g13186 [Cylindrodendrum hubeiense]|uniref:Uncharacterized protein n=1 Tax=Cylindrodendrum hubeiense TaxID=595255 RepID=A0A9P5GSQ0_9HYPO|nr:hypothetical protein G7Z17_g13186 [Cylindrodendrum hubeiense]
MKSRALIFALAFAAGTIALTNPVDDLNESAERSMTAEQLVKTDAGSAEFCRLKADLCCSDKEASNVCKMCQEKGLLSCRVGDEPRPGCANGGFGPDCSGFPVSESGGPGDMGGSGLELRRVGLGCPYGGFGPTCSGRKGPGCPPGMGGRRCDMRERGCPHGGFGPTCSGRRPDRSGCLEGMGGAACELRRPHEPSEPLEP